MTTHNNTWSLGSCSNNSLNTVEPAVPPLTVGDRNSHPPLRKVHAHHTSCPLAAPRYINDIQSTFRALTVIFAQYQTLSNLRNDLSINSYRQKRGSAHYEKPPGIARTIQRSAELCVAEQFTSAHNPAHCSRTPRDLSPNSCATAGYRLRFNFSHAAFTNPTKSGCASSGFDLYSGWNWQPTK